MAEYLDRFILGFVLGAGSVGVLTIIKQLQDLPFVFLRLMITVVSPMFSSAHTRGDLKEQMHLYYLSTDWSVRLGLPLIIFLAIFNEPLLGLYGKGFAEQGRYALWIILAAMVLNLVTGPMGSLLNMSGLERQLLALNAQLTFLHAFTSLLFIPMLGLEGAAIAIFSSMLFASIKGYLLARKSIGLSWWNSRYIRWFTPTLFCLGVGVGLLCINLNPTPILLIFYIIVLYIVFHSIYFLNGLHEDDRQFLDSVMAKVKSVA
jgi:O-antigen/teichoic acid export membrane protein